MYATKTVHAKDLLEGYSVKLFESGTLYYINEVSKLENGDVKIVLTLTGDHTDTIVATVTLNPEIPVVAYNRD